MHIEIVISGFGGQGALFAGQVLAYAAMEAGQQVTWIPSYGPEMRGGTAHCTVIISATAIGSPLVRRPGAAVVMNLPSLDKYEPLVATGGVLVVNSSLAPRPVNRPDVRVFAVPASAIADELGHSQLTNFVLLGTLLAATQAVPLAAVEQALTAHLHDRHRNLLEADCQALHRGASLVTRPT